MLELGLNRTDLGKGILAACFVNDLGTAIALGLIFARFIPRTLIFVAVCVVVFAALPFVTDWFFRKIRGTRFRAGSKVHTPLVFLAAAFGEPGSLHLGVLRRAHKINVLIPRATPTLIQLATPTRWIRPQACAPTIL